MIKYWGFFTIFFLVACEGGNQYDADQVPPESIPSKLAASPKDGKAIVSWEKVPDASYYMLYYHTDATVSANHYLKRIATHNTVLEVGGLENGKTYYFIVRAGNEFGEGEAVVAVSAQPVAVPTVPQNITVTAGDEEIHVSWQPVDGAVHYVLYYHTSVNVSSTNYLARVVTQASEATLTNLENDTPYYVIVLAGNDSGDSVASVALEAAPLAPVTTATYNATGVYACGDYAFGHSESHDNFVSCTNGTDADNDPVPAGQDGHYLAGNVRSFSKVSGYEDHCVQDGNTGLMWEVKQETGVHATDDLFTWYDSDETVNGGHEGVLDASLSCNVAMSPDPDYENVETFCTTENYVNAVNAAGLCGFEDWRLPSLAELLSLMDYGKAAPAIDTNYFPNTQATQVYWSRTVPNSFNALVVFASDGSAYEVFRGDIRSIRLVRDAGGGL